MVRIPEIKVNFLFFWHLYSLGFLSRIYWSSLDHDLMASIWEKWEKAISILAGNLNSGRSYLITAVLALLFNWSSAYYGVFLKIRIKLKMYSYINAPTISRYYALGTLKRVWKSELNPWTGYRFISLWLSLFQPKKIIRNGLCYFDYLQKKSSITFIWLFDSSRFQDRCWSEASFSHDPRGRSLLSPGL